jgi:hypothetical protein
MRKLLVLVAAGMTVLAAIPSLAAADGSSSDTTCTGTLTGATIPGNLEVPDNGTCTIISSTVGRNVEVGKNAFFQSTGSNIAGRVEGNGSLTLFIDTGTTIGGRFEANKTDQVFIFNSTINGSVEAWKSSEKVQVCGNTIGGGLHVHSSSRDILIGDPQAVDCAGNKFTGSDIVRVHDNNTDVELTVRGNTFDTGNLTVSDNSGASDKFVQDNKGGNKLSCWDNAQPFTAGNNTGWNQLRGQCAPQPVQCNGTLSNQTIPQDLVVPDNGSCTLNSSTVGRNVKVGKDAFFQSGASTINGNVFGDRSQTIFIDTGSTVGNGVEGNRTAQVFVYNSTITGDVEAWRSTQAVQICGNTIDGLVHVHQSGRDILVGDPGTVGCAGNKIKSGKNVKVHDNSTDVELVVSGNTLQGGSLIVEDNTGTSGKAVQNNIGSGGSLKCSGNTDPFTGTPNSGFAQTRGQCAQI